MNECWKRFALLVSEFGISVSTTFAEDLTEFSPTAPPTIHLFV
jgi:hypothetical protein